MKFSKSFSCLLLALANMACNDSPNKKIEQKQLKFSTLDKEISTLYKKVDNGFKIARITENKEKNYSIYFYEINTVPENSKQTFNSVQQVTKEQLQKKENLLKQEYSWQGFNGGKIVFVQIQPAGFSDETQLLDKRQEIEQKLTNTLETEKIGEWFAGDIGPGGGNMLFTVNDLEKSMQTIIKVLNETNLDKRVL